MIERPWGVCTYGEGSVDAEPDHAILRLAVNRVDENPKKSLEEAKIAVTAVRRSLRSHGIPDASVASSRVTMHSAHYFGKGQEMQGHQARVEISVRITKMELVEQAVIDAVEAGADEILHLAYDTSLAADLRAEAREHAVAAARSKARLYAEAANVRLGPVVHVEDVEPGRRPQLFAAAGGSPVAPGDDLAPGRVTVWAAVMLGFAIIS